MDKEALLFPVHLAMLIMVIGFFVFFFMALGGVKKVRKITRKVNKRAKKAAVWLKRQEAFKRNWFYEI
jgi:CBS domain containing-hemolysin-like protein